MDASDYGIFAQRFWSCGDGKKTCIGDLCGESCAHHHGRSFGVIPVCPHHCPSSPPFYLRDRRNENGTFFEIAPADATCDCVDGSDTYPAPEGARRTDQEMAFFFMAVLGSPIHPLLFVAFSSPFPCDMESSRIGCG